MEDNPTYYNDLLTSVPASYANPYDNKIELDVKRSFPAEYIHIIDDSKVSILRNILRAFSIRNTTLGYCQGYNIILSRILLVTGFNEEVSFWVFVSIIEDVFPFDFFLQSAGIETDCQIAMELLRKENPVPYAVMEDQGGESVMYSFIMKWLISLFITDVDFDVSNAIIDMLLYFRDAKTAIVMYVCVDAIFKRSAKMFMREGDFDSIGRAIKRTVNPEGEEKKEIICEVIAAVMKFEHHIMMMYMEVLEERERRVKEVLGRIKEKMKEKVKELVMQRRKNTYKEKDICDIRFPCCVMDMGVMFEIEDYIMRKVDFYNSDLLIIDNYFFNKKSELRSNKEEEHQVSSHNVFAGLCIERRQHYCMETHSNDTHSNDTHS